MTHESAQPEVAQLKQYLGEEIETKSETCTKHRSSRIIEGQFRRGPVQTRHWTLKHSLRIDAMGHIRTHARTILKDGNLLAFRYFVLNRSSVAAISKRGLR